SGRPQLRSIPSPKNSKRIGLFKKPSGCSMLKSARKGKARPRARRNATTMNLKKLKKQGEKMQQQMAKTQAELENKTVEVSAAGGKVKVTANGGGDVLAIK